MESPEEFKENLLDGLLSIYWKQWTTLGLSSRMEEESTWIIDLEVLIISTLFIGRFDKRLISGSIEWILQNEEWVNTSRLKRIGQFFSEKDKQLQDGLLPEQLIHVMSKLFSDSRDSKANNEQTIFNEELLKYLPSEYREVLRGISLRGVITEPLLSKPCLLQMNLRGIFGINARAEILIYLLLSEEGNSNQIANEIHFDQKIVYRILEKWVDAGFAGKEETGRESIYFLQRKKGIMELLFPEKIPSYINWYEIFFFFSKLYKALNNSKYSNDKYMLSSLFRNMQDKAKSIGRIFNVTFPEDKLYEGTSFFKPFTSRMIDIIDRIKEPME
jgi:hypothetical protein